MSRRAALISARNILMVVVVLAGIGIGLALNMAQPVQAPAVLREVETITLDPPQVTLEPPQNQTNRVTEGVNEETIVIKETTAPPQPVAYPLPQNAVQNQQSEDLIEEYLLRREQGHSMQVELLQEVARDPETSPLVKQEAQKRILELSRLAQLEINLTGLLETEGFVNPLVVASEHGVTVSLATTTLSPEEAARVGDLVSRMSGIDPKKVIILERRKK